MSSSEIESKIDLLDSPDDVKRKLKKAFCEPGNVIDNGLLSFVKHILFPLFKPGEGFMVPRSDDNGGEVSFNTYADLEDYFADNKLHPADLKASVAGYINKLIKPIREAFEAPALQ